MRLLSLILIWTWLAGRAHCVDSTALLTQLPGCAVRKQLLGITKTALLILSSVTLPCRTHDEIYVWGGYTMSLC